PDRAWVPCDSPLPVLKRGGGPTDAFVSVELVYRLRAGRRIPECVMELTIERRFRFLVACNRRKRSEPSPLVGEGLGRGGATGLLCYSPLVTCGQRFRVLHPLRNRGLGRERLLGPAPAESTGTPHWDRPGKRGK